MDMLTAGATVPGGYYLDRDELDLIVVNGREGGLPGAAGTRYVRVPAWAALLAGPVLGALCVVVIPLLAVVRALPRLGRAGLGGASHASRVSRFAVGIARRAGAALAAKLRRR
jgi:hypothetical protein